jgi:hypothetical protein
MATNLKSDIGPQVAMLAEPKCLRPPRSAGRILKRFRALHLDAAYLERSKLIMLRVMLLSDQFGIIRHGVNTSSRSPSSLKERTCLVQPTPDSKLHRTGRPGVPSNGEGDSYYTDGKIYIATLVVDGLRSVEPPVTIPPPPLIALKDQVWHRISSTVSR